MAKKKSNSEGNIPKKKQTKNVSRNRKPSARAMMEAGMVFEELSKLMGAKMTSEFKVVDVDIDGQEVLLHNKYGRTIIVDLRDQYLTEAQKWKPGDIIKAIIGPAPSRFTPSLVWTFEDAIQLSDLSE